MTTRRQVLDTTSGRSISPSTVEKTSSGWPPCPSASRSLICSALCARNMVTLAAGIPGSVDALEHPLSRHGPQIGRAGRDTCAHSDARAVRSRCEDFAKCTYRGGQGAQGENRALGILSDTPQDKLKWVEHDVGQSNQDRYTNTHQPNYKYLR